MKKFLKQCELVLVAVGLALWIAGCSSVGGGGLAGMSAEQIAASAKIKDANIACIVANSPWGRTVSTYVNVDKATVINGTITVDGECKATYSNAPAAPAASVPR